MPLRTSLAALLPLCALVALPTTTHACALINDGNQPDGWGAAYNVFSSAGELILKADCTTDSFTPEVGSSITDDSNFAVYSTGYSYDGSEWVEMSYSPTGGAQRFGSWIIGEAAASAPIDYVPSTNTFFVAYTCHWRGSDVGWRCGCQDEGCDTPAWQLQAVRDPNMTSPSGGGVYDGEIYNDNAAPGLYLITDNPTVSDAVFTTGYTNQIEMLMSPSGRYIAYTEIIEPHPRRSSTGRRASNVWVADPDGGNRRLVMEGSNTPGEWAPSGSMQMGANIIWISDTEIAFKIARVRNRQGQQDVDNGHMVFFDLSQDPSREITRVFTGEMIPEGYSYRHQLMALNYATGDFGLIDVGNGYTADLDAYSPADVKRALGNPGYVNGNYIDHAYWNPNGDSIQMKVKGGNNAVVTARYDGSRFYDWQYSDHRLGHQHWFNDELLYGLAGHIVDRTGQRVDENGRPDNDRDMPRTNHSCVHPETGRYARTINDRSLGIGRIGNGRANDENVIEGRPMEGKISPHCMFSHDGRSVYFKMQRGGDPEMRLYRYVIE